MFVHDENCLDCSEENEHCHGMLIVHSSGRIECEDSDCVGHIDVHEWVMECVELSTGCSCDDRPGHAHPLAA